ncbi:MAG: potassium transport protein Kup [Pseudomonadota bacterium]
MGEGGARFSGAATLGALGIVYGDIGTSPLYAFSTAVDVASPGVHDPAVVLGVLSLVFWSLLVVITGKYITLMLRADNQGEGGILSLFALVQRQSSIAGRLRKTIIVLAVLGAALYYCDALITPAISVLSAVEGLALLDPAMEQSVVPVTLVVLVLLFSIQRYGTARVGSLFGPVMLLWFTTLAVTGLMALREHPQVLVAVNPVWAVELLATHPFVALAIVGAMFLALTGGEGLYADMGHFGRIPVRVAWLGIVWPALLLNYFGQGAHLLANPGPPQKLLFQLVPEAWLPALVILATCATVIASQAVITSAFSMTRQAVQLDFLPRMRVLQTSETEAGQIYVPVVNTVLMVAVAVFVIGFGSSEALAGAYGAAVAGTMLITTTLAAILAATAWQWPRWRLVLVFGPLALLDLVFVSGNVAKIWDGAWVPITLSAILFVVFMIWRNGRIDLRKALQAEAVPLERLPPLMEKAQRVPGTAVFLTSSSNYIPTALLRNLEHNHVIHEHVVIMHLEFVRSPRQDPADRVRIDELVPGVTLLNARFGFMETPDVAEAMKQARTRGLRLFVDDCSFFVGWHLVRPRFRPGYAGLRRRFFAWMQRRSTQASEFFRMPARRVITLATQVEI